MLSERAIRLEAVYFVVWPTRQNLRLINKSYANFDRSLASWWNDLWIASGALQLVGDGASIHGAAKRIVAFWWKSTTKSEHSVRPIQ